MKITRVNLNKYIKKENITVKEFSQRVGVNYSHLAKMINYTVPISKNVESKIEEYFNNKSAIYQRRNLEKQEFDNYLRG